MRRTPGPPDSVRAREATAPTKPFFQEILDALAAQPTPELALVLDLSQAVGAEQRKTATPLVRRLVAEVALRERPVRDVSLAFFYELMARLLMLGWFEEFQLVIAWYRVHVSLRSTTEGLVVESWENLLDRIPAPRPALSSEEVKAAWAAFVRGLEGVLRTLSDVKRPKPVRRTYSGLEEPQRGFGTVGGIAPTMIEILETRVEQLVGALQILFQQMLEPAVLELEARRTSTRLRKLDGLLRTRFGLFESHARSALVALRRGGSPPRIV